MKTTAVVFYALVFFLPAASSAQTERGTVRGLVTDTSGSPAAGVEIRMISGSTEESRTATTDPQGAYGISALPPGEYTLEVEQPGFKRYVHRLVLSVGETLRIDPVLQVGAVTEEIRVQGRAGNIARDTVSVATVVENAQVTSLPLDGRNFLELALLAPGTVPAPQGSASSVRGDFAFNANGAREDANAYLLDGAYNVDPKLNTPGVKPPVDAIREFEVVTSSYDAAFGRNGGAQVNVVTKSGTNRFGGTAYEFFRNGALDGRNYFAPEDEPEPEYNRHQFGASLGGPLRRNRTFFFVDYEGTRRKEGITRITNVPTLAERRGDFSASLFRAPVNLLTGQPFPGNQIPELFLNPIGRAIANLYPAPNRNVPFRNFVSSPTLEDRNDHFDARLDHALNASSNLAVRYSFADRDLYEPFSGPGFAAVPGFGTNVPRRAQNLVATSTHVFSSTLVNEARFAFTRVAAGSFHENMGRSVNRTVGMPELSGNERDFGLSFITIAGFSPIGDEYNNPQHSVVNTFQVADQATMVRGNHVLKAGLELRATRQDAYRDVQSRGFLTFSDQVTVTGNALADLLLGIPLLTGGARLDNPQRLRTETYSFFVNDSFRIAPTVTLTAGLRYEFVSPPVDADDRATLFDQTSGNLVAVGSVGMPRSGYEADKNNLAPRVGVAWTPSRVPGTTARAAYGIYYDQSALAPGEGLYFSPPYFDLNVYFPLPGLPLSLANPFPSFFPVALPDSALAYQRDLRTPFLHHFSANVQRELGTSRSIEIGYAGSRGRNLITARDINQPTPSAAQPNLRPLPQFADITQIESTATSRYDSLQVRFQQRLDAGVSLLASYTLAKSEDNASGFFTSAGDPNFPQDSRNPEAERSRSSFDVRHRLSVSFSYDLPFGSGSSATGLRDRFVSGWQVAGVVSMHTGRPFTVALLPEIDNSNTGRSNLGFGANDRPNLVGDPEVAEPGPDRWFDTAAFAMPAFGTFGSAGRNILEGPGYQNVNVAVIKNSSLRGGATLQLRLEAFNLFDRANFDLPDPFFESPTFGQILSAQSPRRLQLGIKLLY